MFAFAEPRHRTESKDSLHGVGIIIPTYNAAPHWAELKASLDKQGLSPHQILIIDSSSSDDTSALVAIAGYQFVSIHRHEFSHGATRQAASRYFPNAPILVYMTQDAMLQDGAIENLCSTFDDPSVGACYGRQIPRPQADPIERHARLYNYPETSQVRTFETRHTCGFKAAFFSNSFAAYRKSAFDEVGGFPTNVIVSEDSVVAARLLMAGYKVAYQADAAVIHSHPMSIKQEFSRYFDIGVHHSREPWLLETFGKPAGEGMRFVRSELRYLSSTDPDWIPLALLRTLGKLLGYQLGLHEHRFAVSLSRCLSSHPNFWNLRRGDER